MPRNDVSAEFSVSSAMFGHNLVYINILWQGFEAEGIFGGSLLSLKLQSCVLDSESKAITNNLISTNIYQNKHHLTH